MEELQQALKRLLKEWASELTSAIETFTGLPAIVTYTLPTTANRVNTGAVDEYLWWKQTFEGDAATHAWIGASEEAWSALGSAGANASDGGQQRYLGILTSSLEGAVHTLSAHLPNRLGCSMGEIETVPPLTELQIGTVGITLMGKQLPELIAAIDPTLLQALTAKHAPAGVPGNRQRGPILDRLIDLELPMSVVLGRAVVPIRDVVRLTTGSLVELDHRVGDSVDIVVHGMVVARGEVVSVKGFYGIRIREIISKEDRLALRSNAPLETASAAAN